MEYNLDPHCQMIIDEYRDYSPSYKTMLKIVREQLEKCVKDNGLYVTAIEARIKEEKSLAGKLELKGNKYKSISDLTDILGARVITFYTDEVDKIAALIEGIFEIDWDNSVDKRKLHELDQFGYMSLHYICRIPKDLYFDEQHPEINNFRFEIQMRTALQHVWATMNHDSGYKSGIEVPKEHLRNMNRIAGMLELADEQFSKIRMEITEYRRNVQSLVADGNFDVVPLDGDTFRSFLAMKPFKELIDKIATINQAEIYEDNLMSYIDILKKLKFKTLGDIERLIKEYSDDAYQLALHQLAGTDIDIIALSVALQDLCTVYILKQGAGIADLEYFYNSFGTNTEYNHQRALKTMELAKKINLIKTV